MSKKFMLSDGLTKTSQLITAMASGFIVIILTVVLIAAPDQFGRFERYFAYAAIPGAMLVNYFSLGVWDVWYDDGNIHIENLVRKHVKPIGDFVKVDYVAYGQSYFHKIYFIDSRRYMFGLKGSDYRMMWDKLDKKAAAKFYTKRLNEFKEEIADGNSGN